MPGPRAEPLGGPVLPRLPLALKPIARLALLRFPRWLPAVILPWLPITALLFFFTVLRSEELVCDAERCQLEAHKGLTTRQDPVREVRVEDDEDTKRKVLVVDANGVARFDLREQVVPTFAAYAESRRARTPVRLPVGGRAWWWMFGTIVGLELVLVGYFALAQRTTTLEVEPEVGRVRVLERARGRTKELTTFDLSSVARLELEDLDDEGVSRTVVAVMEEGERRRLFDAVSLDADRARSFLESARVDGSRRS